MLYTTLEKLNLKAEKRFQITGVSTGLTSANAKFVKPELVELVANQIEAKLNMALGQIYKLPIPYTSIEALNIIGAIAEKLIISEIALTHFEQTQNPQLGGDAGFGAVLRKQAIEELQAIFHGHNVYLPGLINNSAVPVYALQPFILPGVPLLTGDEQPDTFSRTYSFIGKREISEEEDIFN